MKLLVPVNFSPNAINAAEYAAGLAASLDGSIHLLHVISAPKANTPYHLSAGERKNSVESLTHLKDKLEEDYGLPVNFDVRVGSLTNEIVKTVASSKSEMIVMGTDGASGIKRFYPGTNTFAVIEQSPVPVLALPAATRFSPPKRVVFGTDFDPVDLISLDKLSSFARNFDAEIYAVHIVNRFEDDEEYDFGLASSFSTAIKSEIRYSNIRCEEYQHADVVEGMRCFMDDEDADVLALSYRHKNLLQMLFTRTLYPELVFNPARPLLVFKTEPPSES